MKFLAVLIVVGPLMSVVGLPAFGEHPTPILSNGPLLKLVDSEDFAARKDAYLRKMRTEMAEWRQKMHAAGQWTEAEAHEASADSNARLNQAWTATERAWRNLQSESAEGWDKAKHAYERSTAELRAQWHKLRPDDQN
jgi:hypothetical protein